MNSKQIAQQKLQEWWESGDEQFDVLSEIFELRYREGFQSGRDAQRESDASLFLMHGDYTSSRIVYAIKNNTGEL